MAQNEPKEIINACVRQKGCDSYQKNLMKING